MQHRVLVNVSALISTSLWRLLVSFALQALVARMLGVTALGLYVSTFAFLNVAQVASEMGLPTLLIRDLAQFPARRRALLIVALRIQLVASVLVWLVLIVSTLWLPVTRELQHALWLVGASLPFYAISSVSEVLFQASERMTLVMRVEMTFDTLFLLLHLVVLFAGWGIQELIGVQVVTQIITAGLCLWLVRRHRLLSGPQEQIHYSALELWRRLRSFYGLALANILLQRFDLLLLNFIGNSLVVGVYSIAYTLVRVLIKLIQSYWQATYPTLSRLYQQSAELYHELSTRTVRYGWIMVLPFTTIGYSVAGNILVFVFGERALASTTILQILLWLAPVFLLETYTIYQLIIHQRPGWSLLVAGVHIVCLIILLPLLTAAYGAVGAATANLMATLVGGSGGLILHWRLAPPFELAQFATILAFAVIAGLVAWLLPTMWLVSVAGGLLTYCCLIWTTGILTLSEKQTVRRLVLRTYAG